MKKLFLVLGLILFIAQGANAQFSEAEYYCPKEPYAISHGVGSFFTTVTGTNFFATKIAEKEISKALKRELGADFKVKLDTFGGSSLIDGKFQKLTAKTNALNSKGLYFTDIKAETMCGFNHVKYESGKLYFAENMVIKYSGKITEQNLKQIIASNEYMNMLNNLNISAGRAIVTKIVNMDVKIQNNRVAMSYDVLIPMFLGNAPHKINFSTNLDVENGTINFCDIDFGNPMLNLSMKSVIPMLNKLNPLVYQVKTGKNQNSIVNVKNVKIVNNEILADGIIVLPRNYTPAK